MDRYEETGTFLRHLTRAEALTAEGAWEEAAALWEQVVAVNPVEGRFWSQLGEARYHCHDYSGAIAAYENSLQLRDGFISQTAYSIAFCQALQGYREEALFWLERALQLGYRDLERARTDDDLASLRDDSRFRERVGLIDTSALSRDEGWRTDLHFLAREVKRRAYAPFQHVSEAQFDAAIATLSHDIPRVSDDQILLELMKLLRLLGDGHAGVSPAEANQRFRQELPVQFFLFEEGLFIVSADPRHSELLGAQALRFGEHDVATVMDAIDPLLPRDNENGQWPKRMMPYRLRQPAILHALGLTPEPDAITLTMRDPAGDVREVRLTASAGAAPERERNFPRVPAGWTSLPQTVAAPLPLYLRNADLPYWFDFLPDERTVYFQFNSVRDDPRESLAGFTERMLRFLDDHQVDRLVVDIRWNHGGNTYLEMPLLHRLIGSRLNTRGQLFVIIGRGTFSAAQNFASLLDRHTDVVFAGEPTGSSPTFVGETVKFTLPYSQTCVNISDLFWQSGWPTDYRIWIAPTLYAPPTFAAFRTNRDPALEAILAYREHLPGW